MKNYTKDGRPGSNGSHLGYVHNLLRNRAVLGEYQAHLSVCTIIDGTAGNVIEGTRSEQL
jgi:hypothetical protein